MPTNPGESFANQYSIMGDHCSPLALIERERHVLSEIALGKPLAQVLEALLLTVEARSDSRMMTSVLFLDEQGTTMLHGAAPRIAPAYNQAIDGIPIGEGIGSCGTAAARGEPVYVRDIANDPLWADFAELALSHGLCACWSMPIKAVDGKVLGTFAVYYGEPRAPIAADIDAIALIAQTAALAIERHRSDHALRRSQRELLALNAELERQVAERARERSRTWLVSPDLLAVINAQGLIEATNPAWTSVLGWQADELRTGFAAFVHPDDAERTTEVFTRALHGQPVLRFENRYRHKDGSYRWLSWVAVQEEEKVYCSARDMTREHEQADALRQAQKMEAVGHLTGGVAHDFNNLLTVIRSSTDLLMRRNLSPERQARYVSAISDTVNRASRLTSQLLAFARRQALMPEVFEVCDSLRGIGAMIDTLNGSRIENRTHFPSEQCRVDADRNQFDTAIVNLVANARDAMHGIGVLTIRVERVSQWPAGHAQPAGVGPWVAVSVTDTGSGIAEDVLAHIYDPFYTTKAVGQGTGLGLSQVFGFAKQSGGDITVTTELGKGSTFTLYLPCIVGAALNAS